MPRTVPRTLAALAALALGLSCTARAGAGEVQLWAALGLRKSTWRGDVAGGPQLGLGYRFAHVVAVDAAVWEEPATVDRRLNTGLSFGVTGTLPLEKVRPTLRLYVIHQHEEGFVSVWDHPFGTVLGIGAGIRHRAGVGARLGVELPFSKGKRVEWVGLGGVEATWFPDSFQGGSGNPMRLGPAAYFGVTAGVGLHYRLEELP